MAITLDHSFLRSAHPKDAALLLHELALANTHDLNAISDQLLDAITSEAVPPMLFALWTSACPDDSATVAGMNCSQSIIVRSSAIRNFRRRLRTAKCGDLWRALGGTQGIIALLADFSVIHVKEFCKAVARCSTSKQATAERQSLVTDLLGTLTSSPGDPGQATRNLLDQYSKLLYTCTPDFKNDWIAQRGASDLDMVKIFELDVPRYQQQCLQAVDESGGTLGPEFGMYEPLFRSVPQRPHAKDPSVSESMAFSAQVFKKLQAAGVAVKQYDWIEITIYSLLNRIIRRRSSYESAREVLKSASYCLQQQPDELPLQRYASSEEERYWRNIVRLWQRNPSLYEPILTPLLRAYNVRLELPNSRWGKDKTSVQSRILTTERGLRYRFLRWIFLNHPSYRVDIEDGRQLKDSLKVAFSDTLLLSLGSADALSLLERYNKNVSPRLILPVRRLGELDDEPRVELLRLHLMGDPDTVLQAARDRAYHSKQMAQDSGSQPVRSAWITASIYFAVASQSLDLLQEIVLWARRFSRDPKTVVELYGSYPEGGLPFRNKTTIALLSGMPTRFADSTTLAQVTQNVRKGNEVMLDLLQSAIQTQSDPSFQPRHWEAVKVLFREAVLARLQRVNTLQSRLNFTDEQIFAAVWKDTIDALVEAEQLGLFPDNESLELVNISGLMGLEVPGDRMRNTTVTYELSPASLRFIDELAVLRESLWKRHRIAECPAVTSIPPPWPRGLTIQAYWFLPDEAVDKRWSPNKVNEVVGINSSLLFLEKRARDVVFMPSEQALAPPPDDDEIRSAIRAFVDDYRLALRIYLSSGARDKREERLQAAWTHATQALSGSRMSSWELEQYWSDQFTAADAPPPTKMLGETKDVDSRLTLPTQDRGTTDPVEWHPGPEAYAEPKLRRFDPLTIDCLASPGVYWRSSPRIMEQQFEQKTVLRPSCWDLRQYQGKGKQMSQDTKEAFIAGALLFVDARAQAGSKILSKPFPSAASPRLPAIFLDATLLDSKRPTFEDIDSILKRFLPNIPPTLLKSLADSLVEKALQDDAPSNVLRRWTTVVLGSLVMSDKPDLATDMIVQIILGSPGETPWHRILLHPGVLKRLSASKARTLMQRLAEGILERLSRQAQEATVNKDSQSVATTPGPYSQPTSHVKVTTAKMLAQVLKDATFLGEDFVVDTLVSLFYKSTHVHVRAAVVDGLSSVLYSSRSDSIKDKIISALESNVVPVAAELNERSPMTEAQWKMAEDTCEPPDVSSDPGLAPICTALIHLVETAPEELFQSHQLVEHLVLPLVRKSRDNNSRWTHIFLRKHQASHLATDLPRCPAKPKLLQVFLKSFCCGMPTSEFQSLSEFIMYTANPPREFVDFTAQLDGDAEAYKRNDVQHWRTSMTSLAPNTISNALMSSEFATAEHTAAQSLVTPAHLQAHEHKILRRLLDNFSSNSSAWDQFLEQYKPPRQNDEQLDSRLCWREHCRPILQYAISLVHMARTETWQQDPQREQSILPDTFGLRLQLLNYPSLNPRSPETECLNSLADGIRSVVEQLAASRKPYHANWAVLMSAVQQCPQTQWMPLALRLGSLDKREMSAGPYTLSELLCIDAADELLTALNKKTSGKGWKAAEAMAKTWAESFDEDVRRKGVKFAALS